MSRTAAELEDEAASRRLLHARLIFMRERCLDLARSPSATPAMAGLLRAVVRDSYTVGGDDGRTHTVPRDEPPAR